MNFIHIKWCIKKPSILFCKKNTYFWSSLDDMKCTPNYRITLIWYLCVEPVGSQGKCPQRLLFWAVNWLKMAEQMVQTWSAHNEMAIGETNWTWQDSCEGRVWGDQHSRQLRGLMPPSFRKWMHNCMKTFELLFRKQLHQLLFTSSKCVFLQN